MKFESEPELLLWLLQWFHRNAALAARQRQDASDVTLVLAAFDLKALAAELHRELQQ